jgi:hypothetical protein
MYMQVGTGVGPHGENGGVAAGAVAAETGIGTMTAYTLTLLCTCRYGSWSSWGEWGRCSRSCGGGTKDRKRACTAPSPDGKGAPVSQILLVSRFHHSDDKLDCNTKIQEE